MSLTKHFPTSWSVRATKLGKLLYLTGKNISWPRLGAGAELWIPTRLRFLRTLDAILDKLTEMWPTSRSGMGTKRVKFLDFYGKLTAKILAGRSEYLVWK